MTPKPTDRRREMLEERVRNSDMEEFRGSGGQAAPRRSTRTFSVIGTAPGSSLRENTSAHGRCRFSLSVELTG